MALKATIYKADISVSDMDRSYYCDSHSLIIAQHPSENNRRLMARISAWIFHASDKLEFTRGLSSTDEPEIWQKNDDQSNCVWIELGHPDEKRIKKAVSLSQQVVIYTYQGRLSSQWLHECRQHISNLPTVTAYELPEQSILDATALLNRTMKLQATIQDNHLWLSNDITTIEIERIPLHPE